MYNKTNWPTDQDPKISAIYALNDIDIKAPAEVEANKSRKERSSEEN